MQAPFDPKFTAGAPDALPQLFLFMAVFSTTEFRSRREAVREAWMVRHSTPRHKASGRDISAATHFAREGRFLE